MDHLQVLEEIKHFDEYNFDPNYNCLQQDISHEITNNFGQLALLDFYLILIN